MRLHELRFPKGLDLHSGCEAAWVPGCLALQLSKWILRPKWIRIFIQFRRFTWHTARGVGGRKGVAQWALFCALIKSLLSCALSWWTVAVLCCVLVLANQSIVWMAFVCFPRGWKDAAIGLIFIFLHVLATGIPEYPMNYYPSCSHYKIKNYNININYSKELFVFN